MGWFRRACRADWRCADYALGGASTSVSAPSRAAQYSFIRVAVSRSGRRTCCIATWLLAAPLAANPTSTDVPSGQVSRIDFAAVAVRITGFTSGSQRARVRALSQARYRRETGTAMTLLFDAS